MRFLLNRSQLIVTSVFTIAGLHPAALGVQPSTQPLRMHNGTLNQALLGNSVATIGDINGDGVPDYAIGMPGINSSTTEGVSVRSGANGAQIYLFPGEAGKTAFGWAVASAGDVNNDGIPDIIVGDPEMQVGCMDQGGAVVYSGADGSMLYFPAGPTGFEKFGYAVAGAGDVNGDGYDDFVVGAPKRESNVGPNAGHITLFSGYNGEILFEATTLPNSKLGYAVASLGDVNGDGFPDIAASAPDRGKVFIYDAHHGQVIRTLSGSSVGKFGTSIANAGDVNGDGVDDLVVGAPFKSLEWMSGKAYIYDGATGALLRTLNGEAPGDGAGTSVAGAGDVNGDGFADVAVGAPWAPAEGTHVGRVLIHSGLTGQVIRAYSAQSGYASFGSAVAAMGDLDNDGLDDVLVGAPMATTNKGSVLIYPGGATELGLDDAQNASNASPDVVAAGDLNGDGVADVVSISTSADKITVQISNGLGGFTNVKTYAAGDGPTSVAIGDYDHDGHGDLAVVSSKTKSVLLFHGSASGNMSYKGKLATGAKPGSIVTADFNHDGYPDLAVTNQSNDNITVWLNGGWFGCDIQNRFKSSKIYAVKDNPVFIAAGNLNGDPFPDLVVVDRNSSQLSVLINNMNGKFAAQQVIDVNGSPIKLVLADFNADGTDDIATLNTAGQVTILLNNGNASFQVASQFIVAQSPKGLVAIDMDYDGFPDLATANAADNSISIFLNNQSAQFSNSFNVATGTDPQWMAAGDMDGDGDKDLVTANHAGNSLSVLLNRWFAP